VLCSDGLTDGVDDTTIQSIATSRPPHEACEMLIEAALAAGGHDNISIGLFVVGAGEPARPAGDTGRFAVPYQTQDEMPS